MQTQKTTRLLELHHAGSPLVLINAWDAASAAIIEQAGLPAIATSSAAVANALGYADGQHVPWPEMLEAISRIAGVVRVPVTADIEAGFSSDLQQLETSVEQIIEVGAVGINLEDAIPGHEHFGPLYPSAEQVARIQLVRKVSEKAKIHLVINARVDAYWQKGPTPEEAIRNTLERGQAYLQAGADCIFVPGLRDPDQIRTVVGQLNAPVNILAVPGTPSIPELAKLGVKRVSFGSGPHRAAMGLLRRIAEEAKTAGTYNSLIQGAVPYAEMNALFDLKPRA